jgi:two-component system OmpR family sensor kinase
MTFRARLLASVTALTLFTQGGAFLAVYLTVARNDLRQLDRLVQTAASADVAPDESQAMASADVPPTASLVKLGVAPASRSSHGVSLKRYEALYQDGRTLSATPGFAPPMRHALPASGCCFDVLADVRLRAALVPVPGQPGVELLLGLPRTDLDSDMALLRRSMLMVFGVTVAWTVLLAGLIVGRLTRGHRRITEIARRVAGGDLDARVGTAKGSREVAQLGRDIDEMIDRLAVLVTSQQQFIAHAAHELRSPLTTLYGELSLAVRRERDAAEYRRTIEEALESTRRLRFLTEDLLALARMGAAVPIASARHTVPAILDEALAAITARPSITVTGDCREVKGNAADLARLLRNLLENAIRHSPVNAPIAISLADRNSLVTITVSDQGPGVAEAERERIFAPFYRVPDDTSREGGAGLGLSIARAIARGHGGDLRCQTGTTGAVFVVELPAA